MRPNANHSWPMLNVLEHFVSKRCRKQSSRKHTFGARVSRYPEDPCMYQSTAANEDPSMSLNLECTELERQLLFGYHLYNLYRSGTDPDSPD